ncbi:MAG: hypothetical protein JEZ06_02280 [Anaerolineaceae bacterium]|nr:hypothetical protein [Anaerolineaceae bacterium]
MGKLIIVACGAGINTSTVAEDSISEYLQEQGITDVKVKRILMADIEKYRDTMTILVSMMKIYQKFDCPQIKGMPFLIGTKAEKKVILEEIVRLLEEAE